MNSSNRRNRRWPWWLVLAAVLVAPASSLMARESIPDRLVVLTFDDSALGATLRLEGWLSYDEYPDIEAERARLRKC